MKFFRKNKDVLARWEKSRITDKNGNGSKKEDTARAA